MVLEVLIAMGVWGVIWSMCPDDTGDRSDDGSTACCAS